jgi:2-pyrone-4,6-dicarboxylate lactonase
MADQDEYPRCPPPDPAPRSPSRVPPPGACDTHFHVFGPDTRYPYSRRRGYTPPEASLETLRQLHARLGITRGVLIQPSAYGADNARLMDALAEDHRRFRAVVAVGPEATDRELEEMHAAGVRGIRVNLADPGGDPFGSFREIRRMATRIRTLGWHLEFLVRLLEFPDLRAGFEDMPVDCVFGHLGYLPTSAGIAHPGFQALLDLVGAGQTWVKLTAPYRITGAPRPPYRDVDPFARALLAAGPERMLWGSDWPHVIFHGFMPNDADLLDQLFDWAPDSHLLNQVLVGNPAALYDFR